MSLLSAVGGFGASLDLHRAVPTPDGAVSDPRATALPSVEPGATPGQATMMAALVGLLGLGGVPPAADQPVVAGKPNLDALNRVLNHYRAQSEASATAVTSGD